MSYDIDYEVRIDVQEVFDNLPSCQIQQQFMLDNIDKLDEEHLVDELRARNYDFSSIEE